MRTEKRLQTVKFPNRFLVYGEVYLIIQINSFLYYLSRLPILGKIVHSSWYSRYRLKRIWSLFSLVFGFIKSAMANNVGTLIVIYMVPHLFLKDEEVTGGVYLILFVLLKCIGGALIECGLFKSSMEDHTFLNHFMVNPVSYYRYKGAKNAFFSGVMLFPAIYFLFRDWGLTAALVLFKLFCMLEGNVMYLSFYKKYGRLPRKRIRFVLVLPLILLTYAGAFLGLYRNIAVEPIWQLAAGGMLYAAFPAMLELPYALH